MRAIAKFSWKMLFIFIICTFCAIFVKMQFFGEETIYKIIKKNGYVASLRYKQKFFYGDILVEMFNENSKIRKRKVLREVDQMEDMEGMELRFEGGAHVKVVDSKGNMVEFLTENPLKLP